jgi:nucleoside phosphorylase
MAEQNDGKDNRTDIPCAVIITALKEECQAVTAHLSDLKEIEDPYKNIYDCGYFAGSGQEWSIAVAEIGVGNTCANYQIVK